MMLYCCAFQPFAIHGTPEIKMNTWCSPTFSKKINWLKTPVKS